MGSGWGVSVVSVPSLPAGHPVLLGGHSAPWRWVARLLPDPHRVVLGHDPVIAGPLKEVALEVGEKTKPISIWLLRQRGEVPSPLFAHQRSSQPGPPPNHNAISLH